MSILFVNSSPPRQCPAHPAVANQQSTYLMCAVFNLPNDSPSASCWLSMVRAYRYLWQYGYKWDSEGDRQPNLHLEVVRQPNATCVVLPLLCGIVLHPPRTRRLAAGRVRCPSVWSKTKTTTYYYPPPPASILLHPPPYYYGGGGGVE